MIVETLFFSSESFHQTIFFSILKCKKKTMPYPNQLRRKTMRPKRMRSAQAQDIDSCAVTYNNGVRSGCTVQCDNDVDCMEDCMRKSEERFPVQLFCPGAAPNPCNDCDQECQSSTEMWAQRNCAQACPDNTWDWENPACASCMVGALCVYDQCLGNNCKEPCDIPGGQLRRQRMRRR